eukprot:TRINITY_DN1198_c0_g1_i1.p3 TRINITY_DN1198_c0_g1~~TRINITY_DN1198_c0_g1_i1.p3  ORF type:complete len:121 (-),score=5.63 TRINITY_DN1198_c0_g1_i1:302-664(-)
MATHLLKLVSRANTVMNHFRARSEAVHSFCFDSCRVFYLVYIFQNMKFDRLEAKEKSLHAFYDIAMLPLFNTPAGISLSGAYGLLADITTTMAICIADPLAKKTVLLKFPSNIGYCKLEL